MTCKGFTVRLDLATNFVPLQIASSLDEESWQQADNEPASGEEDALCLFHPSCWSNVVKNPGVTAAILSAISQQQQREQHQLALQQQHYVSGASSPAASVMYRQGRSSGAPKDKYASLFDRFSKKSRFGSAVRRELEGLILDV